MTRFPKPPGLHEGLVKRYPKRERAWGLTADEGRDGPLDDQTPRLVKLAAAIGAMREGAVHASVR